MKFKKFTALALAAALTVASLSACGASKDEAAADTGTTSSAQKVSSTASEQFVQESEEAASEGIVFPLEENMTFSMFTIMNGETSYNDVWGWQQLEERTNVSFDLTEVTVSEASEKANLILASGDYPEVFFKAAVLDADDYGQEGIFIPLEDLIREYAPTLTALLDERDLWDELSASDGHVYAMPDVRYQELLNNWLLSYNEVWLDNLGLEVPTTIDEFYEVLKAIKEQDANGNGDPNDEIPLVCCSDAFTVASLFSYFGTEGIYNNGYFLNLDAETNEISFYPTSEEFKNLLATFAQWYEEGLIDNACFTQKYEEYFAIGKSSDQYGFIWGDPVSAVGDRQNQYVYIDPIEGSQGLAANAGIVASGLSISDMCENPEVIVAWCDNFYDLETRVMVGNGQQGVDWDYDENGKLVSYGTGNPVIAGTVNTPGRCDAEYMSLTQGVVSTLTGEEIESKIAIMDRLGVVWPTADWSDEDKKTQFSDLRTNLLPTVKNYIATVVVGDKSLEDTWDDFQAELEKMGVKEYVEIYVSTLGDGYTAAE